MAQVSLIQDQLENHAQSFGIKKAEQEQEEEDRVGQFCACVALVCEVLFGKQQFDADLCVW